VLGTYQGASTIIRKVLDWNLSRISMLTVSSAGLGPGSDCSGKAQKQFTSILHTNPLVREGVPHQGTSNCQTENKNLVMGSR
jgi:hypothetical protein